jgi:gluconate 5-dehydrogenase
MNFTEAFSLKNETALITGGGSGIGLAMARSMLAAGAKVVIVGRREPELAAACKELGAHALVRAFAPGMIERKHGHILFTASMASLFGIPNVIAYTAAKSAMVGLVRGYAVEFSPHGVRVNAIAPGWIDTAMSRKAMEGDPARKNKIIGRTPMAKFGDPEDIGWAAAYLASPAAKFVTGVILPVDGGVSIGF